LRNAHTGEGGVEIKDSIGIVVVII